MSDERHIDALRGTIDASLVLPGSKSLTNRALLAAGLAQGRSTITGALDADDTAAMIEAITVLGAEVVHDVAARRIEVEGVGGHIAAGARAIDARQSGTTGRFLLPVLATGDGTYHLTGHEQLLRRPMAGGAAVLRSLGVTVDEHGETDHLPVTVHGGGVLGAEASVRGDASSQLVSGLLLAAPLLPGGLVLQLAGPIVSRSYLDMTLAVQRTFGADARWEGDDRLVVAGGGYAATSTAIEPDATSASYFLAAAALLGGRVRIRSLGSGSVQGDAAFAQVLGQMGAAVTVDAEGTEVRGTGTLRGIDVDLSDMSDTAPTLAVVAALATGPTRMHGIGFIRHKESDRIGDVARELRRCGIRCDEEPDALVVHPGPVRTATVQTYDDHRIAMSFAVLGLATGAITIADPGCVAKTFPTFFVMLDSLQAPGTAHVAAGPSH